jgi:hypothetical protein
MASDSRQRTLDVGLGELRLPSMTALRFQDQLHLTSGHWVGLDCQVAIAAVGARLVGFVVATKLAALIVDFEKGLRAVPRLFS